MSDRLRDCHIFLQLAIVTDTCLLDRRHDRSIRQPSWERWNNRQGTVQAEESSNSRHNALSKHQLPDVI
jgi:hypothetical protein